MEEVKKIVRDDLAECDEDQIGAFQIYAVEPHVAPIIRYGKLENVVVVARKGDEAIYWEDIEEAFNLSVITPDGRILDIGAIRTNCALRSMRGLRAEHVHSKSAPLPLPRNCRKSR